MKIYLAGPMTGVPHFNFPLFNRAATAIRERGHTVFNPAEHDIEVLGVDISADNTTGDPAKAAKQGFSRRRALRDDLSWICEEADAIALLPGWMNSKGARAEFITAAALDLKFFNVDEHFNLCAMSPPTAH